MALDLLERLDEMTEDPILKSTCEQYAQSITKVPFTHESLLCDRKEHQLTSAEKRRAEREYFDEKRMYQFSSRSRLSASRSSVPRFFFFFFFTRQFVRLDIRDFFPIRRTILFFIRQPRSNLVSPLPTNTSRALTPRTSRRFRLISSRNRTIANWNN